MKKEDLEYVKKREIHREKEMQRIKRIQSNEIYANKLKQESVFGNFEKARQVDYKALIQNLKNKKGELFKEQKNFIELQKNLNKTTLVMNVPGATKIAS